ncbi:MAG: hypothetical protein K0S09_2958 [Sphingobacteriaceae bacterium]|jgi:hypothetical protein|nr:hypothetical protein [Sphingobacteriaceae bacterium]
MQVQTILVALLFVAALAYVGRSLYKTLKSKKGCASNCGKCGVDFSNIDSLKH